MRGSAGQSARDRAGRGPTASASSARAFADPDHRRRFRIGRLALSFNREPEETAEQAGRFYAGSLGLEVEDFTTLTDVVRQVAATHAEGKLVSLLEGGYNLDVLPDCVAVHLEGLLLKQLK